MRSESLSVCLSLAHINRITGRLCSGAMDPFNRRPPSDQCSHNEKNRESVDYKYSDTTLHIFI